MTMSVTVRRWILAGIISTLVMTPAFARGRAAGRTQPTPSDPVKKWVFEANQMEYYLGDDGVAYIRPGVKVRVASITNVAPGQKPVVDLFITDNFDQPLDRAGKVTPGVVGLSFILAWYDPVTREYTSYTVRNATGAAGYPGAGQTVTQASADSNGKWTDLEMGHATYTFGTAVPQGADLSKTHTLGIYGTRNLTDIIGKNYVVNLEHDFRPDGGTVTDTWNKITTASCNNCHDPLAAHGGSRQDLKLCVLCHSPQTTDPETMLSMDMEILVHKIHAPGTQSEPYVIIGNRGSVHDYSEVTFPQDVRNCDNCHEGITAAQKTSQSHLWYSEPTRDACGACHDTVNFATGEGHHGVPPQADDSHCSTCHTPDSGAEFDASIKGAHVIPTKSKQLAGVNVTIGAVTNMEAGKTPTVAFKVVDDAGNAVDASKLNTFAPILAGPTSSYRKYFRENAVGKGVFDAATGNTVYTFTNAIPADAVGTWTISGDFYKTYTITRAVAHPETGATTIANVRDAAFNPIKYVALDGGTPEPRRMPTATAQCNQCHDQLALHGGQRQNVEECVICHNPTMTDQAQRPAEEGAPEAISMQYLIHRVHKGHLLERDFTVYGNGRSRHNYNEVTYPGDLRNCLKCHVAGSYVPPVAGDAVVTPRDYFSPMGSATASCLGCHDSRDAAAHAFLNTTEFGGEPAEACGACHGAGSTYAADKVHAR
jgi:OmcA/MtrC family decaheme c-type cytochrome